MSALSDAYAAGLVAGLTRAATTCPYRPPDDIDLMREWYAGRVDGQAMPAMTAAEVDQLAARITQLAAQARQNRRQQPR